jgi:hypothetical protein
MFAVRKLDSSLLIAETSKRRNLFLNYQHLTKVLIYCMCDCNRINDKSIPLPLKSTCPFLNIVVFFFNRFDSNIASVGAMFRPILRSVAMYSLSLCHSLITLD